jgi:bisphosphoglycerate-independent phosphoglycerate mutase (AlkP superfamily)
VLAPENGFDPKGALTKASFTYKDQMMVGMHTFDDAFLYVGRSGLEDRPVNLLDVAPTMLSLLGIQPPAELDRRSLV